MIHRAFLVTNIKLEKNEPYVVELPTVYSDYAELSQPFLRTHAVNFRDITFDHEELDFVGSYWTQRETVQPMIMDLIDDKYEQTVEAKVTPMLQSTAVVLIDQDSIDNDGIELAIFMKLQETLPIYFLVEYNE